MTEQIVAARVEQIVGGDIFIATDDGRMMRAPNAGHAVGDTVHARVRVKQTLLCQEIGPPGALGDLSPPAPSAAQVVDLIDRIVREAAPAPVAYPKAAYGQPAILQVPKLPTHYVPNPEIVRELDSLFRISEAGETVRIMITGSTGLGKTSTILAEAALRGRPVAFIEGGEINAPDDWFGQTLMDANGTYFEPHPFVAGVETPGAVVIIDEASRVRTPQAFNTLMGLLSDLGSAYCHGLKRRITVADGVIFACTMNIGPEYTGTTTQDIALQNRLSYPIHMDYLPADAEARALIERYRIPMSVAEALVKFAWVLRRQVREGGLPFAPSTRTLLDASRLIGLGGVSPQEAVERVVLRRYHKLDDDDEARTKVLAALQGTFAGGGDRNIEQLGGGSDAQTRDN